VLAGVWPTRGVVPDRATGGVVTEHYYHGDRLVATREGATLRYVHQDHLGSSNVGTDTAGASVGSITYYPFGETRASSGSFGTDRKFTGQRLDNTGLYYYNARYYDAGLVRFVSADTLVPEATKSAGVRR
jgi:RHS repeat-associated protein